MNKVVVSLNDLFNSMEVRKNKLATTRKKMFFDKKRGCWRLIGVAHDYSYYPESTV
jgi:hypothetical protein